MGLVGAAACRAGVVVLDLEREPGMVADRETVMVLRAALGDNVGLNGREDLDCP